MKHVTRSLLLVFVLLTEVAASYAQPKPYRKWVPNNLGMGYYVVDSYDNAPLPWKPVYRFFDTTYEHSQWHRIAPGPDSFTPDTTYHVYWQSTNGDTTNDTYTGAIPLGFTFNFYGNNYDSVYLSSNGYIGFGNNTRANGGDGPSFASKAVGALPNTNVPKAIAAFMMTDGKFIDSLANQDPDYYKAAALYRTSDTKDTFYLAVYKYHHASGGITGVNSDNIYLDVEIVLTKTDSSITFYYRKFYGVTNAGFQSSQVFRLGCIPDGCSQLAALIGVQDSTQTMGTTYMADGAFTSRGPNAELPDNTAIQFKRWENVCQADSIIYPPANYEMLAGDSIKPVAVFGNVSAVPQTFYCIFRVRNAMTGDVVYQAQDSVSNLASMQTQRVYFPAYITNLSTNKEIGTMVAEAIASPYKDSNVFIGDYWPFDDTLRETMFVLRQVEGFEDFNNNFSNPVLLPGTIPDVLQWVNINANVVDGESYTYLPPPPRRLEGDPNINQLNSPVIVLDRNDDQSVPYPPCSPEAGDTIISFPIDLHTLKHAVLGFSYERGGKLNYRGEDQNYPRWYDFSVAYGPERTVTSPDGKTVYRTGDSLDVDFADPSQITNVTQWHEAWAQDGGKDFNFTRVYIPIDSPSTSPYFRFRIRLKAKNDFVPGNPRDDADAWFLDNFVVSNPILPELEVSYVRIAPTFPYLRVPASQATAIPIEVSITNNGGAMAQKIGLHISIYTLESNKLVYDTIVPLQPLSALQSVIIPAVKWNARLAGPGEYSISAYLDPINYDAESQNDSTYCIYQLGFDSSYVYDSGINAAGYYYPTMGLNMPENPPYDDPVGGDSLAPATGTISVKFTVYKRDTIQGVQAYFASADTSNAPIAFTLYNSRGNIPGAVLSGGCATTVTERHGPWDDFSLYLFDCGPVILDTGEYWIGISQRSGVGFELGGDDSRSSVDWRVYDTSNNGKNVFVPNNPEIDSVFAFEDSAGSGNWVPFYATGAGMPAFSYPVAKTAYPVASGDCGATYNYFFGEGTWIPMIRPYFGIKSYGIDTTSSSVMKITTVISQFALAQNYPNPFTATTQISYTVPLSGIVSLKIYDALGREVRTLVNGYRMGQSQPYYAIWDGRDNNGVRSAPGIYICKLEINGNVFSQMLSLLR
ncbi:MAG TPA: T9SS type A sorting domain-containing protein [Candidatus Kapabacteria bacterium]|nr:T9SS type A sorting domain-containing protein [Candidatus Kapabacteria bacterium]